LPGLALPEAPPSDAMASVSTPSVDEYLVSVGLFASRERADQLVDALTQAGLPALQRSVQLRGKEVQQIALGPYFSRTDAVTDLRRLLDLGGYDDAQVVDSSQ
jgi:cell division septation protein DedD